MPENSVTDLRYFSRGNGNRILWNTPADEHNRSSIYKSHSHLDIAAEEKAKQAILERRTEEGAWETIHQIMDFVANEIDPEIIMTIGHGNTPERYAPLKIAANELVTALVSDSEKYQVDGNVKEQIINVSTFLLAPRGSEFRSLNPDVGNRDLARAVMNVPKYVEFLSKQ
jgi:hypothetical protein